MQTLRAHQRVDPRDAPAPPGVLARIWQRPLGWHLFALTVVLLATMALTHADGLLHADEGAALAQARLLADGDGWALEHPFADVDPTGEAFPIGLSTREAGTDRYVPFSKHPAYPVLLTPLVGMFGNAGGILLSVAGTVGAAAAAALLARRIDPALDRWALWCAGLATPLFADSYLVIAHTLGAALAGFSVVALTRRERSPADVLLGCALFAGAVLLRNEAILLGLAIGAWSIGIAVIRRAVADAAVGVAVVVATVVAALADRVLASMVVTAVDVPTEPTNSANYLADRIVSFGYTVLAPSDGTSAGFLAGTLVLVLLVAAAVTTRRKPDDIGGIRLFVVAAALAAVARLVLDPTAHVPGLLFAAPLVFTGLVGLRAAHRRDPVLSLLLGVSALFGLLVVATQYRNGGGGGWGGRYFAIALPLVVPVAVVGLAHLARALDRPTRRIAGVCLLVVVVSGAIQVATSVSFDHRANLAMTEALHTATALAPPADGDDRPVVVSTRAGFGRREYELVLEQRWLEVIGDGLDAAAAQLHARGIERLVLATDDPEGDLAAFDATYRVAEQLPVVRVAVPFGADKGPVVRLYVLEAI